MITQEVENSNFAPMPQEYLRVKRITPFIGRKDPGTVTPRPLPQDSVCDCCDFNKIFTLLVLADTEDSNPLYNDFSSFLYEMPTDGLLTFTLQKHNGITWVNTVVLNSAYGTDYPTGTFTDFPLFAGFKLQWRIVLQNHGEGNYRIKATGNNIDGDSSTDFSGIYCLKEYSQFSADTTVRFQWNNNGIITNSDDDFQLINYGNINWSDMIRLTGAFGFAQDEETKIDVSQYSGDALKMETVRHLNIPKYLFKSGQYPDWVHSILKNYAFKSNSLNVTTYSRLDKHVYSNKQVAKESNGYAPNYDNIYNKWYRVEVSFRDKYDDLGFRKNCITSGQNCEPVTIKDDQGNFIEFAPSGSEYIIPSVGAGSSVNVSNSDDSYSQNVACGGLLELPDTTVNVYIDGALNQTVSVVTLGTDDINISL